MFLAKALHEVKIGQRVYQFLCDHDAPLKELVDVLGIVQRNAQEMLDKAESKKKEDEAQVVEPSKIEKIDG